MISVHAGCDGRVISEVSFIGKDDVARRFVQSAATAQTIPPSLAGSLLAHSRFARDYRKFMCKF